MAKFNLTKIVPDGFLHHMGFDEVMASLAWSLSSLGHFAAITQNWLSERNERNIVFGAELGFTNRLPPGTIIFNLEQPSHPNMEKVRKAAKDSNAIVWDYSSRAVDEWKAAGHPSVYHLPIGYTPNLTRIPKAADPDIDVLFYGWMTPRRNGIVEELKRCGLNVVDTSSCYGGGRDNLISRSKVVLNVHHDGRDRFEIVRCSYLMANSTCIVSEASSDDDEYADLKGGLSISPYRLLVDTCRSLCRSSADNERHLMGATALSLIEKRDFPAAVAAALDALPAAPPTPQPSRPIQFKAERSEKRSAYLTAGRSLSNVQKRYEAGCAQGDMKDFLPWLREHAKGNVFEIGVRDGASTSAFLLGVEAHGGHVYSCDVADCSHLFPNHPQWTFIHANSTDYQAVTRQIPFELDLLLIDGDHSRAGVLSDFEYVRQVRPGGYVLFHDIEPELKPTGCSDMSWPGDDVKNVFEELTKQLVPLGWTSEKLPGRYGLGVLRKPVAVPIPAEVTLR